MENIEIKARVADLNRIRKQVLKIPHQYVGLDHQIDTYFITQTGRMKLRESKLSGAYMVLYLRDDIQGPKTSTYQMIPVKDPDSVKTLLTQMLGLQIVVEKERDIFLYKNVRIHLDRVRDLGEFMELEAVMDETYNDKKEETEKINNLLELLNITEEKLLSRSYRELVEENL
jgi:predicted adenylyl cyclase CyaB